MGEFPAVVGGAAAAICVGELLSVVAGGRGLSITPPSAGRLFDDEPPNVVRERADALVGEAPSVDESVLV